MPRYLFHWQVIGHKEALQWVRIMTGLYKLFSKENFKQEFIHTLSMSSYLGVWYKVLMWKPYLLHNLSMASHDKMKTFRIIIHIPKSDTRPMRGNLITSICRREEFFFHLKFLHNWDESFPSLCWKLCFKPTSFHEKDSCSPSQTPQHGKHGFHYGVCIYSLWIFLRHWMTNYQKKSHVYIPILLPRRHWLYAQSTQKETVFYYVVLFNIITVNRSKQQELQKILFGILIFQCHFFLHICTIAKTVYFLKDLK